MCLNNFLREFFDWSIPLFYGQRCTFPTTLCYERTMSWYTWKCTKLQFRRFSELPYAGLMEVCMRYEDWSSPSSNGV